MPLTAIQPLVSGPICDLSAKTYEDTMLMIRSSSRPVSLWFKRPATPRQEIVTLYSQHNRSKLSEVDGLISKYGEKELLRMVRKKYVRGAGHTPRAGLRPQSSPHASRQSRTAVLELQRAEERVVSVFSLHRNEELEVVTPRRSKPDVARMHKQEEIELTSYEPPPLPPPSLPAPTEAAVLGKAAPSPRYSRRLISPPNRSELPGLSAGFGDDLEMTDLVGLIEVSCSRPGPLGLRFCDTNASTHRCVLERANTALQGISPLQPGLLLSAIRPVASGPAYDVSSRPYADTLGVVRSSARPVTLWFKRPDTRSPIAPTSESDAEPKMPSPQPWREQMELEEARCKVQMQHQSILLLKAELDDTKKHVARLKSQEKGQSLGAAEKAVSERVAQPYCLPAAGGPQFEELHQAITDGVDGQALSVLIGQCGHDDTNAVDAAGQSCLYVAASHGHCDAARQLVSAGVNINAINTSSCMTALHIASASGHAEIVEHLLSAGADAAQRNRRGKTAVFLARQLRRKDVLDVFERCVRTGDVPRTDAFDDITGGVTQKLQALKNMFTELEHVHLLEAIDSISNGGSIAANETGDAELNAESPLSPTAQSDLETDLEKRLALFKATQKSNAQKTKRGKATVIEDLRTTSESKIQMDLDEARCRLDTQQQSILALEAELDSREQVRSESEDAKAELEAKLLMLQQDHHAVVTDLRTTSESEHRELTIAHAAELKAQTATADVLRASLQHEEDAAYSGAAATEEAQAAAELELDEIRAQLLALSVELDMRGQHVKELQKQHEASSAELKSELHDRREDLKKLKALHEATEAELTTEIQLKSMHETNHEAEHASHAITKTELASAQSDSSSAQAELISARESLRTTSDSKLQELTMNQALAEGLASLQEEHDAAVALNQSLPAESTTLQAQHGETKAMNQALSDGLASLQAEHDGVQEKLRRAKDKSAQESIMGAALADGLAALQQEHEEAIEDMQSAHQAETKKLQSSQKKKSKKENKLDETRARMNAQHDRFSKLEKTYMSLAKTENETTNAALEDKLVHVMREHGLALAKLQTQQDDLKHEHGLAVKARDDAVSATQAQQVEIVQMEATQSEDAKALEALAADVLRTQGEALAAAGSMQELHASERESVETGHKQVVFDLKADYDRQTAELRAELQAASTPAPQGDVRVVVTDLPMFASTAEATAALRQAVMNGDLAGVQAAVKGGGSAEARPDEGMSAPLHEAAGAGRDQIVRLLVESGAALEQKCQRTGFTPLLTAAKAGEHACVMALVEAGADVTATNSRGRDAHFLAKKFPKVLEVLENTKIGKRPGVSLTCVPFLCST